MLIRTFKDSYAIQYLLLLVLSLAVWAGVFISPVPLPQEINKYISPGTYFLTFLSSGNPVYITALGFVINFLSALYLNFILSKNGFTDRNTLFPALTFITFTGHSILSPGFLPVIIAVFFTIVALDNLFAIYSEEKAYHKVFNTTLFTGLASFFYLPSVFLLPLVWITFIVYSLYRWREWVISILGFITPYLYLFTWYFWNDELDIALINYRAFFNSFTGLEYLHYLSIYDYIIEVIILLIFAGSVLHVLAKLDTKPINLRKWYMVVFWLFVVSTINFFMSNGYFNPAHNFVMLPVIIFSSVSLPGFKRKWVSEMIFSILLLLIISNNIIVSLTR